MKKMTKRFVAVVLMFMMALSLTVTAFAGERFESINVSTSWQNVASDTEGFGCRVKVIGDLTTIGNRIDVRMLDKNGNEIWRESKSCPGNGYRVYECGSNVCVIQVKVSSAKITGDVFALKTDLPVGEG